MVKNKNDDLFAESSMTFGEHLEELRGALFRSLVGLIIGFLIGLSLAKPVVRWIEKPVADALKRSDMILATDQLKEKHKDAPSPEMLAMIQREGLIPETIKIEPFGFLRQLKGQYPDRFAGIDVSSHRFSVTDVPMEKLPSLCAVLVAEESSAESPARMLGELLTPDEQKELQQMATNGTTSEQSRITVVRALNRIIREQKLYQNSALGDPGKLDLSAYDDGPFQAYTKAAITQLSSSLQERFDPDDSERFNHLMISGILSTFLPPPRMQVVELQTWTSADVKLQTLGIHEMFMIWVKAAVISGIIISSPWIFYQIWLFVAAGLYPHERKYIYLFLPFSLALFLAGAAMAYFAVFRPVLDFLLSFNRSLGIPAAPRFSEWLGFVLLLPLGFGVSFQLPLIMLFLQRIGIFTVASYLEKWRIAILIIFVASMLLTPADPVSMLLMALPLTILYFGGIALCRWLPRSKSPIGPGYDPA